jgi:uncharacterized protein
MEKRMNGMANGKWTMSNGKWFFIFAICHLPFAILFAAPHYPSPQGYVTDGAQVLDPAARRSLESQLAGFEKATSDEIAVVTVPSLDGETIETYANNLFIQWRIGKKEKNNGLLILVAVQNHKARIEVGYGLESVLTDGTCGDIIRGQMVPCFRQNQYARGLAEAVSAIQGVLTRGALPPSAGPPVTSGASAFRLLASKPVLSLFMLLFFVLPFTAFGFAVAVIIFILAGGFFRLAGLLFVGVGLLMDFLRWGRPASRFGGRGWGYGGFYGGGGFGGGGFGGGSGFGGFGGGMSGGGGASGGW